MFEETLCDNVVLRRVAEIELVDDRTSLSAHCGAMPRRAVNEPTILNFRHLLERHGLTEAIFTDVHAHLSDKGIMLRSPLNACHCP
jgi:IS5 family transposase